MRAAAPSVYLTLQSQIPALLPQWECCQAHSLVRLLVRKCVMYWVWGFALCKQKPVWFSILLLVIYFSFSSLFLLYSPPCYIYIILWMLFVELNVFIKCHTSPHGTSSETLWKDDGKMKWECGERGEGRREREPLRGPVHQCEWKLAIGLREWCPKQMSLRALRSQAEAFSA